jgi:hypothetical protein
MIGIERWLDVLSILVIAGIIGALLYSMTKRGVRMRSLSEKPALFLEFTGKQVSVRRRKSKILPSDREQAEAHNIGVRSPATDSRVIRISRTLTEFKDACLATRHDSLRVLRECSQRGRILMTATGRQTSVIASRVVVALRARLDVAKRPRVEDLTKRCFTGGVQERLTEIRKHLAGARINRLRSLRMKLRTGHFLNHPVKRLRQGTTDVLLYLDYRWYRVERSLQSQSRQFKAVTSRLARIPFKDLHVVRVLMLKTQDGFAAQERVQTWLRQASSVILQRQQDLVVRCRRFQNAVRDYTRRLSGSENPEPARSESLKSTKSASPGSVDWNAAEPVLLSLTSSGTLKLKTRVEDESTSIGCKSGVPTSASSKGAPSLSQVSVRYVGAQRRYGDPAESRQSKQAVK